MRNLQHIVLKLVALLALTFVSCEMEEDYTPVDFHVHKSCAQLNPPKRLEKKVIYTKNEFNASFRYVVATTEDVDPVDFSKSFVLAVCGESLDMYRTIEITEVLAKDMVLYVKFKVDKLGEISYKMAPCAVASISRDYAGYDVAFYDVTGME